MFEQSSMKGVQPINKDLEQDFIHDFEIIYNVYPRKEGKVQAYKHFRAWSKGKDVLGHKVKLPSEVMLKAVLKYKEECEISMRDKKYIKMASTFFNNIVDYIEDVELYYVG